jgi:SAM-dependent methyltransferase
LTADDIRARAVLEVGALDVNGSLRSHFSAMAPQHYIGVDIQAGPGVDRVCDAADLVAAFGPASYDVVISTELLEHARDWRAVVHNFKGVLRPDGIALITTRSRGFRYHAYPHDYWRYEIDDIRAIFADFHIEVLAKDPESPGVFLKARKPREFAEVDLTGHALHSVIRRRRALDITEGDVRVFAAGFGLRRTFSRFIPEFVKRAARRVVGSA